MEPVSNFNTQVLQGINLEAQQNYQEFVAGASSSKSPTAVKSDSMWNKYMKTPVEYYGKEGGTIAARKAGEAYGPGVINNAVSYVVDYWWPETQPASFYERTVQLFTGTAKAATKATAQIAITPYAAPVLSMVSGATGALAVPALITMVELAVNWMKGPDKFKPIKVPTLEELVHPDAKAGLMFDELGRMISDVQKKQLNKLLTTLDMTNELLNKKPDEVEQFVKSYLIYRQDDKILFLDGQEVTPKEFKQIQEGIELLKKGGVIQKDTKKSITKMVDIISSHNTMPLSYLTAKEMEGRKDKAVSPEDQYKGQARRMPPLFQGEEQDWKNWIIKGEDGTYCTSQDTPGRLKGQIITPENMKEIFKELEIKEREVQGKKVTALKEMVHSETKDDITAALLHLDSDTILQVFEGFIIERNDGKQIALNGQVISPKEMNQIKEAFANLSPRARIEEKARAENIHFLVEFFTSRLPSPPTEAWQELFIKGSDGVYSNLWGTIVSEEDMTTVQNLLKEVSIERIIDEFHMIPENEAPRAPDVNPPAAEPKEPV